MMLWVIDRLLWNAMLFFVDSLRDCGYMIEVFLVLRGFPYDSYMSCFRLLSLQILFDQSSMASHKDPKLDFWKTTFRIFLGSGSL